MVFIFKSATSEHFFELGEEIEVTGGKIGRIRRVFQQFPRVALEKLGHHSGLVNWSIVVMQNDTFLKQIRSFLSNCWSQFVFEDPPIIVTIDSHTNSTTPLTSKKTMCITFSAPCFLGYCVKNSLGYYDEVHHT